MKIHSILQYSKSIAGLVGFVLTSVAAALPDVPLWLVITIAAATAVSVWAVPNTITDGQLDAIEEAIAETPSI